MSAPASDLLDAFSGYQGEVLFRGLSLGIGGQPPVLGRIGWLFTGFGAVFALWGFVLRSQHAAPGSKLEDVARTWVVLALMLAAPVLMRSAMQAADAVYEESIGGPATLTTACVKAAYAMPELTLLFDALRAAGAPPADAAASRQRAALISSANDGSVLGYLEAFGVAVWDTGASYATGAGQTWSGLVRLSALATGFGAAMLKCLLILATIGPLYLLLLFSAALIWFMGQLRYFLAVTGAMMLPLFIGMYSMPQGHPNRQAAHAYIMHMVSLALWPVAWTVGHTGTIALYDALIALISGTSRVPDLAGALQWSSVTAQPPSSAQVSAMQAALGNWFMGNLAGLLSILVGALGFAAWVAAVSVLGPVFLHRLLTTGSHFFAQAAASTSRGAVGAGRALFNQAKGAGLGPSALMGVASSDLMPTSAPQVRYGLSAGPGESGRTEGVTMASAARQLDDSDGKGLGGM